VAEQAEQEVMMVPFLRSFGPWRVKGPSKPNGPESSRDFAIVDDSGRIVAETFGIVSRIGPKFVTSPAEAHARLMAASPKLLSACEFAFKALMDGEMDESEIVGVLEEAIEEARNLKKVEAE
jgi:hypothetical protein